MLITEIYKALSDESRLRILNVLSAGVFNVQELTAVLGLSQPTVSHHLKVLTQCGVISCEKEGTWAYYRLKADDKTPSSSICRGFLSLIEEHSSIVPSLNDDNREIKKIIDKRRDEAKTFFDSIAKDWKKIRGEIQGEESFLDQLARSINTDLDLLELGCGTGTLLEKILPRTGKTFGIDYSEAMLDAAKKNLGARASGVDLRLGYLEHLPLGDDSVDCAVAHMVLHHIADPKAVLRDTARVLRSGGTLKIVEFVKHAREEMRERYADLWLGFDINELTRWTEEAGFNNVEVTLLGQGNNTFLLTAISN